MKDQVLHVFDHSIPLQSGYTFRSQQILKHQRERGIQTLHVTSIKHYAAKSPVEVVNGLTFYRTLYTGWMLKLPIIRQWIVVSSLKTRMLELLRDHPVDVIHAHSPALNGLAAIQVGKKLGIPVVYEVRAFWEDAAVDLGVTSEGGFRYRLTVLLENWVLKHCTAITTICEGLRSAIVARGFDANKITVIPNAVDPDVFKPQTTIDAELQESLSLKNKTVIGFIGSFYHYEGLQLLIQSLPAILKQQSNVKLLMVGGGNEEQPLRKLVKKLGLNKHVIFTGRVPHDQVQRYYGLIDIFIYPRLPMRLTELVTPLKPLEAMAQKKIVIASDVGGHRELIKDGHTGFLFQANDVESLSDTVLKVVDNRNQWHVIQDAGRHYIETKRNWKTVTKRYLTAYKKLTRYHHLPLKQSGNILSGSSVE
jgi:PEP-CTERM/exosortase A-associated glycosyltransferase